MFTIFTAGVCASLMWLFRVYLYTLRPEYLLALGSVATCALLTAVAADLRALRS